MGSLFNRSKKEPEDISFAFTQDEIEINIP